MTKINVKGPIVSNDSAWLYRWLGWDACCVNDINTGLESANGDDVLRLIRRAVFVRLDLRCIRLLGSMREM
mgnify:CR=1 FL=1